MASIRKSPTRGLQHFFYLYLYKLYLYIFLHNASLYPETFSSSISVTHSTLMTHTVMGETRSWIVFPSCLITSIFILFVIWENIFNRQIRKFQILQNIHIKWCSVKLNIETSHTESYRQDMKWQYKLFLRVLMVSLYE